MDRGAGGVFPAAGVPLARRAHPDLHPVRAVARPDPRLRRHHHARAQRVLRARRVCRRHRQRQGRHHRRLRADGGGGHGGGTARRADGRCDPAHARPHAAHAHPRHYFDHPRDRQQGDLAHRRRRRPVGSGGGADPRRLQVRPFRQDRLPLLPGGAVRRLVPGAAADLLALRRHAHRHARKHPSHARHRRAGLLAAGRRVHRLGGDGRRRRRAAHADQPVRRPERARLRAFGRAAGDADPGRSRPPVRRVHRPAHLPGRAGPARQAVSRILVSGHRPAARGSSAVRPRRDFGVDR